MNKKEIGLFMTGMVIGMVMTHKYFQTKYQNIAQVEIDSVREVFQQKEQSQLTVMESVPVDDISEMEEYTTTIENSGYSPTSATIVQPYVISPGEFGENSNYMQVSLTYFSDHILTDEDRDIIEDVEGTIGLHSLNAFGEYEEDAVFVRNDRLKCDYEILLEGRPFEGGQ